ncbi:hypothetical protein ACLOJK_006792, partial [Asimina triloba]
LAAGLLDRADGGRADVVVTCSWTLELGLLVARCRWVWRTLLAVDGLLSTARWAKDAVGQCACCRVVAGRPDEMQRTTKNAAHSLLDQVGCYRDMNC